MKKTLTFIISIMMVFTMTPIVAFAETDLEEETVSTQNAGELKLKEFHDDGSQYTMEDISQYNKTMRIYAFFLGNSDEYGDAVLIESNGRFLLMDTGHKDSASRLKEYVKGIVGDSSLDVYISHMHGDHTGGLETVCSSFNVGTVYLPDIETCENYVTPKYNESKGKEGNTIDQIYKEKAAVAKKYNAKVVYLRPDSSARKSSARAKYTTSQFNVGGAVCKVLGPLGTYYPDEFIGYVKELNGHCGTKEGHCLNNCSLCTMVSCGNVRYLATGDVEKKEEGKLAGKYGTSLNSDIMKMPHHGLRTSCTSAFASKVTPMWSFALNHDYITNVNQSAINVAKSYGYNYKVASAGKSIGYDINNGVVRVYIDNNKNNKMDDGLVKGWVNTGGGYQYYNGSGKICTGWNWIGNDAYYMSGSSGFRFTGNHTIRGKKCKFRSNGKLYNPAKPAKVKMRSAKAKKGHKVIVKWKKTQRASGYLVYKSTKKGSGYICIGRYNSKKRSITDTKVVAGKTYYYKVRAVRTFSGATLYGSYSVAKKAKAK